MLFAVVAVDAGVGGSAVVTEADVTRVSATLLDWLVRPRTVVAAAAAVIVVSENARHAARVVVEAGGGVCGRGCIIANATVKQCSLAGDGSRTAKCGQPFVVMVTAGIVYAELSSCRQKEITRNSLDRVIN